MQSKFTKATSVDKFIAYFDVLGWSSLVRNTEQNNNASLIEIVSILDMMKRDLQSSKEHAIRYGPEICPCAPLMQRDIDFCFSTWSDSVVISTEVSQAGLVNLINCCRVIYFNLFMHKGLMCRGYIGRGSIYHTEDHCVGSGLCDVVDGEKRVSVFRTDEGQVGTPFIELDRKVIRFMDKSVDDDCVKQTLSEFVKRDGNIAAVFPFKRLDPGLFGSEAFNLKEATQNSHYVRKWIEDAKRMIACNVETSNAKVRKRSNCLAGILDAQLEVCKKYEGQLREMSESFPTHSFEPRYFSGLFDPN